MKKFLFVGDTNGNTGPANVNKGIVAKPCNGRQLCFQCDTCKEICKNTTFGH